MFIDIKSSIIYRIPCSVVSQQNKQPFWKSNSPHLQHRAIGFWSRNFNQSDCRKSNGQTNILTNKIWFSTQGITNTNEFYIIKIIFENNKQIVFNSMVIIYKFWSGVSTFIINIATHLNIFCARNYKNKMLLILIFMFFSSCTTHEKCPYYGSPLGYVKYSNKCISISSISPPSLPLSETKVQKVCKGC